MNGSRQKFCEGIVSGLTAADAYRAAYPSSTPDNARKNAPRLAANGGVQTEIARQRRAAEEKAGSAVMTLVRKRLSLAAIVESPAGYLNGKKVLTSDVIAAIKLDNDLAGVGSESGANDALAQLLRRIRT